MSLDPLFPTLEALTDILAFIRENNIKDITITAIIQGVADSEAVQDLVATKGATYDKQNEKLEIKLDAI